jgi:hypothetical protein
MVRLIRAFTFLLVFLAGCAAYKELTPKPELTPAERGYIELKNGDESFTLEKDTKYFIKFPAPASNDFLLVLRLNNKPIISSHLTSVFDDGDSPSMWIHDEAVGSDTTSVYAIDTRVLTFFWVIDDVRADTRLTMHYRYAPRWRYTFENRYVALQQTLRENVLDRTTYESIGPGSTFEGFNFSKERNAIDARTSNLAGARDELVKIGALFPANIISQKDTAYQQYSVLKASVDDELRFQENYAATLGFFEREQASRGNTAAFLESAPLFAEFLGHPERYRPAVVERAKEVILSRLPEIPSYYDNQLRSKDDVKGIVLRPSLDPVKRLHSASGQPLPAELGSLEGFVGRFNVEAAALQTANGRLADAEKVLQNNPAWTSEALYTGLITRTDEANAALVESQLSRFERQRTYPCVAKMALEIAATRAKATALRGTYSRAREIAGRVTASAWPEAEAQLRDLSSASELNAIPAVKAQKDEIVNHIESELFSRVKNETELRVDAFITKNELSVDNVPGMYQDAVFRPVYLLTFSASGPATVQQRNKQIADYLIQAMHVRFPERAVKALYRDFVRNIANQGAEKARAIADHGKEYQGTDKDVKAYISECDPTVAKWIVRPKEYRKVFALPSTTNRQGTNEYLVRLRLNIPSEAQFPVFDVTLKLPPEVASKAGSEQWYQEITINKKPIKNEGRFRITAPKPDNNYESLITPVQMDKEGNNILEIRFKYPGYRAFEVSAMAQVPIIRKN